MKRITANKVSEFRDILITDEKSPATVEKYIRDIRTFAAWLGERCVDKHTVLEYKAYLVRKYMPSSVNSVLSSLNIFFDYNEWYGCKVKPLKIQKQIFASKDKELSKAEYERLLDAARSGKNERLYLLIICSMGIRVSEVRFVTAEAVKNGVASINCKGKLTFEGFSDYEHIAEMTVLPPSFDEEKMAIVIGLKNAAAFDSDICTLEFRINENAPEGVYSINADTIVKLSSAVVTSSVNPGKVTVRMQKLGDIDGNDTVDIDDAVLLFRHSMLPELYPISYAGNTDYNHDGNVDIDDAVMLFRYSMLPELYPID